MATRKRCREPRPKAVPMAQFLRFRWAKSISEIETANNKEIGKGLLREARHIKKMKKQGRLNIENGFESFISACKRRIPKREWPVVYSHSELGRRFAYCIAKTREGKTKEKDHALLEVVKRIGIFHDIGKTFIAKYLLNKERGTWFGIGKGAQMSDEERAIMRFSHLGAGLRFLELYGEFIKEECFHHMAFLIAGHHMAFDGEGSASAPAYWPKALEAYLQIGESLTGSSAPIAARIMRAADVYSAIAENRFYLRPEQRITESEGDFESDDAALGALIAVAGIDVDPEMVKYLLIGKYNLSEEDAEGSILNLACRRPEWLKRRDGDLTFAKMFVYPSPNFRQILETRNRSWDSPMTTRVLSLIGSEAG